MTEPIKFKAVDPDTQQKLVRWFSESIQAFNMKNDKPVMAVVYVMIDENGASSVGWHSEEHPWPAKAILGCSKIIIGKLMTIKATVIADSTQ